MSPPAPTTPRWSVPVGYALFVVIGLSAGFNGVLLLAQLHDYGVDRTTIGLTFFTFSGGFVAAGAVTGSLIHRWGTRLTLTVGVALLMGSALVVALRPPFVALVLVQFGIGLGTGILESGLNAYLAVLPGATPLLNRLHAFFGVGAFLGPAVAVWMLTFTTWPAVMLLLALCCLPLGVATWLTYPAPGTDPLVVPLSPTWTDEPRPALLTTTLRRPAVLLGAGLLAVYVGLEIGVGTWAYGYLVESRSAAALLAGYTVSGYWLGLTLGRFLISPVATRIGLSQVGLMYTCLTAVAAASALTWAAPSTGLTAAGLVLLGFFLGPIFPTTMALAPRLAEPRLMPTAIGVMNAGSVVGGSALPWLSGVAGQHIGIWTLLPVTLALATMQLLIWWRMANSFEVRSDDLPRLRAADDRDDFELDAEATPAQRPLLE